MKTGGTLRKNKAERYRILVKLNDTETSLSEGKYVYQLFEEQAKLTPELVIPQNRFK